MVASWQEVEDVFSPAADFAAEVTKEAWLSFLN